MPRQAHRKGESGIYRIMLGKDIEPSPVFSKNEDKGSRENRPPGSPGLKVYSFKPLRVRDDYSFDFSSSLPEEVAIDLMYKS